MYAKSFKLNYLTVLEFKRIHKGFTVKIVNSPSFAKNLLRKFLNFFISEIKNRLPPQDKPDSGNLS